MQCPKAVLDPQDNSYWPSVGLINMGKHRQGPRSELSSITDLECSG